MKKYYFIMLVIFLGVVSLACTKNTFEIEKQSIQTSSNTKSETKSEVTKTTPQIVYGDTSSKFVVNAYHPVIFAFKDNNGFFSNAEVLGGSKDDKWFKITDFKIKGRYVKPEDFLQESINENYVDTDLVKGDETYKFYSQNKFIAKETGAKPILTIPPANGENILSVKVNTFKADEDFVIGINGEWDALPRIPKQHNKTTYTIDLDGDGKDEILSIVVKNKEKDKNINIIIKRNGQNIQIAEISVDGEYIEDYKVLTLDINGDGKLEILTVEFGHNTSVSAYQINNGVASETLHFYNGD